MYFKYFESGRLVESENIELDATYGYKDVFCEVYKTDQGDSICKATISCDEVCSAVKTDNGIVYHAKIDFNSLQYRVNALDIDIYSKSLEYDDASYELDLSNSDLSDVIIINVTILGEQDLHIIFPDSDGKRARPIGTCGLFEHSRGEWVSEELPKIDTSNMVDAEAMFRNSSIGSFDFNKYDFHSLMYTHKMFSGCPELVEVKGILNGKGHISVKYMFNNCYKLEHIQDDLFKGREIIGIDSLFSGCRLLKNIPIHRENVSGIYKLDLYIMLSGCNSLNSLDITRVLVDCFCRNTGWSAKWGDVLYGYTPDIRFCKCKIGISKNMLGVFSGVISEVVDLRDMRITGYIGSAGIVSLLSNNSVHLEKLRNLCKDVIRGFSIDDNTLNSFVNKIFKPKIVIVNKSMPIKHIDKIVFRIVDMRGAQDCEIDAKINLMKMMSTGNTKYLIISSLER